MWELRHGALAIRRIGYTASQQEPQIRRISQVQKRRSDESMREIHGPVRGYELLAPKSRIPPGGNATEHADSMLTQCNRASHSTATEPALHDVNCIQRVSHDSLLMRRYVAAKM